MFKMTFNKPSVKMFFQGEDAIGIKVKLEGHKVFFRPVSEIGPDENDVVPITLNKRGGAEAVAEGSQSGNLLQLLTNPLGYPYYLLKRTTGGWMEAIPHTGPRFAPERWEAHLRVWPREALSTKPVDELNLHNDDHALSGLPASQQMRDTLRRLEDRAQGVTDAPQNVALEVVHEIEDLIHQFKTICNDNPLPNPKVRKTRTYKPRASKIPAASHTRPFRSIRERAFASA
ncbi:MAG: hypothetical protein EOO77_25455 [Oxalobacteraceae bacterium]|nr:MAG: hypothetical protein EOO77_25455 [Oxalobacteraceae bacterium]